MRHVIFVSAFIVALFTSSLSFAQQHCYISKGAYKPSVDRWHRSMKRVGVQGTCWIGSQAGGGNVDRLHKNGARDTIIYAPPSVNFSKPITIIFWWHGLGGFSEREFTKRILPNVAHLSLQGHNFVLVISELAWSKNTKTPRGRQGRSWIGTSTENFSVYYSETIQTIAKHIVPKSVCEQRGWCGFLPDNIVIIGHSAGGSAIKSAAKSGALESIQPDRIVFSDAGYGRWTDTAWKYHVRDSASCDFILLVRKWDKPYKNTLRFLKRFRKKIPKNIHLNVMPSRKFTHTNIGDQALLWAFKNLDFQD